jgi:transcriptional regulator with XRE-family HTH domain
MRDTTRQNPTIYVREWAQWMGYANANQLAKAARLTYAQSHRYWHGRVTQFDLHVLQRIGRALKVPVGFLFADPTPPVHFSEAQRVQQEADIKHALWETDLRRVLPPSYFQQAVRCFHVGYISDGYQVVVGLLPASVCEQDT